MQPKNPSDTQAALVVRIKKKTDGAAALSCVRPDGSVTWQRQDGQLGRFFPLHDLTHLAVETVLGFGDAFYGLLAQGWDISSFDAPRLENRLPEQARLAELIVGFFDLERATGYADDAEAYNWKVQSYFEDHKLPPTTFRITDAQLQAIRALRTQLFSRWNALPPGETLELDFQ